MSFSKRKINLTFQLSSNAGTFSDGSSDTVSLTGLRVSCVIHHGGISLNYSQADLRIYGMTLSTMNRLSLLGKQIAQVAAGGDQRIPNRLTISVGDEDNGVSACFVGIINQAWVDMENAPDGSFIISAFTTLIDGIKPVAPTSYNGVISVSTLVSGICAQMDTPHALENNGVTGTISYPYLAGTLRQQLAEVQRTAHIEMAIDDLNNVVAIWPKGSSRNKPYKLFNKDTGLVGYPTYNQNGIQATVLFDPTIIYGAPIKIESILTPATGTWTIYDVTHDLESETPGGKWFTTLQCSLNSKNLPVI